MLEETNDSGTVTARYTTESGSYYEPLLHMRRSSTEYFPLYDAIGTARMLVDASATVTDTYHLDAWGSQLASTGSTTNPYRYGGAWGYITDPSGMLQLGARFYWPEVGRFVGRDPARDGINWYAYARGNPVRETDPTGLWCWTEYRSGSVSWVRQGKWSYVITCQADAYIHLKSRLFTRVNTHVTMFFLFARKHCIEIGCWSIRHSRGKWSLVWKYKVSYPMIEERWVPTEMGAVISTGVGVSCYREIPAPAPPAGM